MSRKAGTPNKATILNKSVEQIKIDTGYKDDKFELSEIPVTTLNEPTKQEEVIQDYKYRVITFYNLIEFEKL